MSVFVGISLICHLVLIFSVVDIEFSKREVPSFDVYEVSIVSDVPHAVTQSRAGPRTTKKYVYHKGTQVQKLSGIKKDRALKEKAPEFSPSDIEPVERQEFETLPDLPQGPELSEELSKYASTKAGSDADLGKDIAASSPVVLWKGRVRSLVDSVWKTPPEISIMDMSLKTTYLLRISRNGMLLDKRLLVSSGNSPFDRSVLLAMNRLKKLPQPPLILIAGRDSVEITMSFTPPKEQNK